MTVTRDFDAMLAERAGTRPTFKVAGQEFTLRSKLPYAKWNKLIGVMRSEESTAHEATVLFYETVLIKPDRKRFLELLSDPDEADDDEANVDDDNDEDVIDMKQLDDITEWIMEHFTGKAPSSSNGSTPGASETGAPQNVVSLQPRTTSA